MSNSAAKYQQSYQENLIATQEVDEVSQGSKDRAMA